MKKPPKRKPASITLRSADVVDGKRAPGAGEVGKAGEIGRRHVDYWEFQSDDTDRTLGIFRDIAASAGLRTRITRAGLAVRYRTGEFYWLLRARKPQPSGTVP